MSDGTRVRRTSEQIAADLDTEIEQMKAKIAELENRKADSSADLDRRIRGLRDKIARASARKKELLSPKKHRQHKSKADRIRQLVTQAQRSGLALDEIAGRLGVDIPK